MTATQPGRGGAGGGVAIVECGGSEAHTARIAGTGIEVFAVYRTFAELGRRWEALREAFHWLTAAQLRAALDYADAHVDAMDERMRSEATVEERLADLWRRFPHTDPART